MIDHKRLINFANEFAKSKERQQIETALQKSIVEQVNAELQIPPNVFRQTVNALVLDRKQKLQATANGILELFDLLEGSTIDPICNVGHDAVEIEPHPDLLN